MSRGIHKPLLICLMGPTASGKTDLAIELSRHVDCELISVDSALVYRGLDIGSAKPEFPHHLIDIRDPSEVYSAADFVADTRRLVEEITARGKVPLLVGGTMLYFKAYLEGLAEMPASDAGVRSNIETEAARSGWPVLHEQLAQVDTDSAARIHPNHSQRISRALEVYRVSGVTMTEWRRRQTFEDLPGADYRVVQMAICPGDRQELHRRIALRFEKMMADGFLDEVTQLYGRGDLHLDLPSMRAVGYRQLWQHLEGKDSLEGAISGAEAATRQLAKRQLTWLRKWPKLDWIYTDRDGNVDKVAYSEQLFSKLPRSPLNLALRYLDKAHL